MHRLRQGVGVVTLAVLALAAAPSPVFGSYAQVYQQQLNWSAIPGEANNVVIAASGGELTVKDAAGIQAGPGCRQVTPDTASCTETLSIVASSGDGNDRVVLDRSAVAYASARQAAFVDAGPGDDDVVVADSTKTADANAIEIVGGPGADDMSGRGAVVNYRNVTSGGVDVTLDGIANDGNLDDESAGRRDNVGAGMSIFGTNFADRLVGDEADNYLRGLPGNDEIAGGKGRDFMLGETGDDTLLARDGETDTVACGPGADTATIDSPTRDSTIACEHVDALAGQCEKIDRLDKQHPKPKRFGAPSRPAGGGLYVGKTVFGLPVRLNVARNRLSFVPASRLTYKWCTKSRVQQVDIKISNDKIRRDGSFDIRHNGFYRQKSQHERRLRGRFWDHGRHVSGVLTETAVGGHAGPVIFEAKLTPRS